MPVRNAHWYSQNEGRPYPLDDTATSIADDGNRLPANILVDMNLRWPSTLGRYAFVSAVSNTPAALTLTIQAANSPDDTSSFSPLAVLTVRKPIAQGRMYQLLPQLAGVAGWVVFGSGADDRAWSGRFSSPAQGLLALRSARSYRPLPVTSAQAQYASEKLTGVVLLKATEPLRLTKEERLLGGALRDCVVLRLVDGEAADGFQSPENAPVLPSVFQRFAGPCAGRPESNTCGCPEPIQFVNAVAPDCNGKLTVEFLGCAQVAQILEKCGVAVACQFGLVDACLPPQIPSSEGLLPSEYEPANIPVPPDVVPPPMDSGSSDSRETTPGLPFLACFSGGSVDVTPVLGLWDWDEDDSPTQVCPTEQRFSESISYSCSLSESIPVCPDGFLGSFTLPLAGGTGEYAVLDGTWRIDYIGNGRWQSEERAGNYAYLENDGTWRLRFGAVPFVEWLAEYVPLAGSGFFDCTGTNVFQMNDGNGVGTPAESVTVYPTCSPYASLSYWTEPIPSTGSLQANLAAARNVAIFEVDTQSVWRQATLETKILPGPSGARHNAGLIINYRPHQSVAGQYVYFLAEVDYDTQQFRLRRFNGTIFQDIVPATVIQPGIQLEKWFRVEASLAPVGDSGTVRITTRLTSITDPGVTDVTLSADVNNLVPATGKFGLHTNRSVARFAYLKVEEYVPDV